MQTCSGAPARPNTRVRRTSGDSGLSVISSLVRPLNNAPLQRLDAASGLIGLSREDCTNKAPSPLYTRRNGHDAEQRRSPGQSRAAAAGL